MPKTQLTPQQKKQLSYRRDHYVRGGESMRAWRQTKRVKKRHAIHTARQKAKTAISKVELEDSPAEAAARRYTTVRQKQVYQWGARTLGEHAEQARAAKEQQKTQSGDAAKSECFRRR